MKKFTLLLLALFLVACSGAVEKIPTTTPTRTRNPIMATKVASATLEPSETPVSSDTPVPPTETSVPTKTSVPVLDILNIQDGEYDLPNGVHVILSGVDPNPVEGTNGPKESVVIWDANGRLTVVISNYFQGAMQGWDNFNRSYTRKPRYKLGSVVVTINNDTYEFTDGCYWYVLDGTADKLYIIGTVLNEKDISRDGGYVARP